MTRKTTNHSKESPDPAEQQELAGHAMVENARSKIAAIDQHTQDLQRRVDKKVEQIREIEGTVALTEQDYEQTDRAYGELGQRITRENVKLNVAKGTAAEAERAEILASVTKAFDEAQDALALAVTARDEARAKQGLAVAIMEEIEEHTREIAEHAVLRREYEAVLAEVHAQTGRELAQVIADGIIEARDAFEDCEKELAERRSAFETATRRISTLRDEYPELASQLWSSHGHLLQSGAEKTHGEVILESLKSYITTLLEHGPHTRTWVFEHKQRFPDYLTLDPSMVQELLKGTWQRKRSYDPWGREIEGTLYHPRFDLIDKLIKDERQNISHRSVNW